MGGPSYYHYTFYVEPTVSGGKIFFQVLRRSYSSSGTFTKVVDIYETKQEAENRCEELLKEKAEQQKIRLQAENMSCGREINPYSVKTE